MDDKLIEKVLFSAAAGGVGMYAFSKMNGGSTGSFNVPGYGLMNGIVYGGLLGSAASIFSSMAHSFILPHIPEPERLRHMEGVALAPASAAAAFVGGAYISNPELYNTSMFQLAAIGGLSEMVGEYARNMLIGNGEPVGNTDFA